MSARPWPSLLASLIVHGGTLAAVMAAVGGAPVPTVLLVDLTREPLSAGAASASVAAPPGGASVAPPARPARARGPARSRAPLPARAPQAASALPEPTPAVPAASAAVPTPAPEARPPSARSTGDAIAPALPAAASPTVSGRPAGGGARASVDNNGGTGSPLASDAPGGGAPGAATSAMRLPAGQGGGGGDLTSRDVSSIHAPADQAADHGAYLDRVRRRIQEALHYPLAARRRGLSGTVLVEILIGADGAIGGAELARSSSHRILDDAALDAVRAVGPVPFPTGAAPRPLRVRLPVVFELR